MFHFLSGAYCSIYGDVNARLGLVRKDAVENRKAIVEVASTLFAQEGADVSIRTIAKEADVGVATATRHFPDKEDLYRAVLEHTLDQLRAVIDDHVERFPDHPKEVWRSAVHSIVDLHFPAVGQEIIPKLAPKFGMEELGERIGDFLSVYPPLLQLAADHKLCPAKMSTFDFHFGIVALSRPLPEPAESLFSEQRACLVDLFLAGLQAKA